LHISCCTFLHVSFSNDITSKLPKVAKKNGYLVNILQHNLSLPLLTGPGILALEEVIYIIPVNVQHRQLISWIVKALCFFLKKKKKYFIFNNKMRPGSFI